MRGYARRAASPIACGRTNHSMQRPFSIGAARERVRDAAAPGRDPDGRRGRLLAPDELRRARHRRRARHCARGLPDDRSTPSAAAVIDMAGDSVLAIFETASGAVVSALAIQAELGRRSADVADDCRMQFRIGIHLGDVIEKSRRHGLRRRRQHRARASRASPSRAASRSPTRCSARSASASSATFDDLGEQRVKNIAEPVRAYRVLEAPVRAAQRQAATPARSAPAPAARATASTSRSIAVLPFTNMSGDPEQEFFADGITEDIITELSRFRELFVISRNSSFKYKGRRSTCRRSRASSACSTSSRAACARPGKRVRITVQLIDAETDRHVWAERYDRDLEDIFAIQDEVTTSIVADAARARRGGGARSRRAHADRQHGRLRVRARPARCCTTAATATTTRRRSACSSARSSSIRAMPTRTPGRRCVARPDLGLQLVRGADPTQTLVDRRGAADGARARRQRLRRAPHPGARSTSSRTTTTRRVYHQRRALSLNPNDDLIVVQQGEILTWLGQAGRGHRVDPEGDAPQSLPPGALLEPSRRAPASRPAATPRRSRRSKLRHRSPTRCSARCWPRATRSSATPPAAERERQRDAGAGADAPDRRRASATLHYRRPERPRAPPRGARTRAGFPA